MDSYTCRQCCYYSSTHLTCVSVGVVSGQLYMSSVLLLLQYSRLLCSNTHVSCVSGGVVSGQLYMSSVLLLLQYSRLLCERWSSKWTVIHVVSVITAPILTSPV